MPKIPSYSAVKRPCTLPPNQRMLISDKYATRGPTPSSLSARSILPRILFPFLSFADTFNLALVNRDWYSFEKERWKQKQQIYLVNNQNGRVATLCARLLLKILTKEEVDGTYELAHIFRAAQSKITYAHLNDASPLERKIFADCFCKRCDDFHLCLHLLPKLITNRLDQLNSADKLNSLEIRDCAAIAQKALELLRDMSIRCRGLSVLVAAGLCRIEPLRLFLSFGSISQEVKEEALQNALQAEACHEVVEILQRCKAH